MPLARMNGPAQARRCQGEEACGSDMATMCRVPTSQSRSTAGRAHMDCVCFPVPTNAASPCRYHARDHRAQRAPGVSNGFHDRRPVDARRSPVLDRAECDAVLAGRAWDRPCDTGTSPLYAFRVAVTDALAGAYGIAVWG